MASKQAWVRNAAGGGVMHVRAGLSAPHAVAQLSVTPPRTATCVELNPHVDAMGGGGEGGGGLGESGVTHGQNRLNPVPLDVQDHEFEPRA